MRRPAGNGINSHLEGLSRFAMLAALQRDIGELHVTGQSSVSGNPYVVQGSLSK